MLNKKLNHSEPKFQEDLFEESEDEQIMKDLSIVSDIDCKVYQDSFFQSKVSTKKGYSTDLDNSRTFLKFGQSFSIFEESDLS